MSSFRAYTILVALYMYLLVQEMIRFHAGKHGGL